MKMVLYATILFILLILPLIAMEALVMPSLQSLSQSYSHADAMAQRIADAKH
jgi:hypothetical protein